MQRLLHVVMNCPICGSQTKVLRTERGVGLKHGLHPFVVRKRKCSNETCRWIGMTEEGLREAAASGV
jgi:hypothetical protein